MSAQPRPHGKHAIGQKAIKTFWFFTSESFGPTHSGFNLVHAGIRKQTGPLHYMGATWVPVYLHFGPRFLPIRLLKSLLSRRCRVHPRGNWSESLRPLCVLQPGS